LQASAWPLLAFAIALAGTWLAGRYARRRALFDLPGERRSHAQPTPRGGGIAIVVAVLPLLGWLAWRDVTAAPALAAITAGLLLVAGIGWLDDHRPLGPAPRLLVHAVAAGLLALALALLGADPIRIACGFVLALVLVNVWNFMDGIDSLAASQALLAALAFALFAGSGVVAALGCVLAAACAGFLPFNLPRARIFLGDVGSGALGFLLAVLASLLLLHTPWTRAPLLVLPLLVFAVDAALTLARRIVHGERWWQPHVQHAYQRWARRSGSHGRVCLAYMAASLVAIAFMLAAGAHSFAVIMWLVGLSCVAACLAWWWLQQGQGSRAGEGG
jgi:UDP-N-acetylmuramyl pentapeptide phosphotransferase/UDP-N-acetylglucosamine-1-phosphate transferase